MFGIVHIWKELIITCILSIPTFRSWRPARQTNKIDQSTEMLLYIPGVNHFRTKCHTSSANVPYSPTLLCHVLISLFMKAWTMKQLHTNLKVFKKTNPIFFIFVRLKQLLIGSCDQRQLSNINYIFQKTLFILAFRPRGGIHFCRGVRGYSDRKTAAGGTP